MNWVLEMEFHEQVAKNKIYSTARNVQALLVGFSFLVYAGVGIGLLIIIEEFERELGIWILPLFVGVALSFVILWIRTVMLCESVDYLIRESLDNDLLESVRESQRKFPPKE